MASETITHAETPLIEARDVDTLLSERGLRSRIAETFIGSAAMLHLAATLPDVDCGVSVAHGMMAENVTAHGVRIVSGQALLPNGAGLGIMPNAERLARFTTAHPAAL